MTDARGTRITNRAETHANCAVSRALGIAYGTSQAVRVARRIREVDLRRTVAARVQSAGIQSVSMAKAADHFRIDIRC